MTNALVESWHWSRGRWCGMVALVFGVQLALIFWLGETSPIRPRPAAPAFTFYLAGTNAGKLLALHDPTLFVLPHWQGAAIPPGLQTPVAASPSFQWPEPANNLLLATNQLGTVFNRFIQTNDFNSPRLPAAPRPALTLPYVPPLALSAEQSTLRLEGELAQRRLLSPPSLPSWTNQTILADSVVRIAVDADGRPVSVVLLSSSGSPAADRYALEQAQAARFEPLARNPASIAPAATAPLNWGRLIFRWHTLPPPPSDIPAAKP